MNRLGAASATVLTAVTLSGCGGGSAVDVGALDPDRPLYEARCAVCHGPDGAPRGPSALSGDLGDPDWHSGNPETVIREVVLDGRGKMPPFRDKLTEAELSRIVAYVQRLPELKSKK